jgi:hypothetical protein
VFARGSTRDERSERRRRDEEQEQADGKERKTDLIAVVIVQSEF